MLVPVIVSPGNVLAAAAIVADHALVFFSAVFQLGSEGSRSRGGRATG